MLISDSLNVRLAQVANAKIAGGGALGNGSSISLDGNDAVGQVNLNTGSNPQSGGLFHVTFTTPYEESGVQPFVFIQCIDQPALVGFHCTIDWWGWDLIADSTPKPHTNYPFAYFVASRPWAMYLGSAKP